MRRAIGPQQAYLFEERRQGCESHDLGFAAMGAASCDAACLAGVETDTAVGHLVGEQEPEEVPAEPVDVGHEELRRPPHVRSPLAQTVTGELDVAGLLGDMNAHQALHHRLQLGIVHHLSLQRVEDLLTDQRRHPQQRALERERQ